MPPVQPSHSAADPGVAHHYILGTAGHIDHGKTTLVRALTGIDTDRLPEEQRRGMTIELGFAELTIDPPIPPFEKGEDGGGVGPARFGVVDVPGHERFVRTMVMGATGIDIALIVVAADDSVMPQTIEHVEILHLLGVRRGVVAVTKTDTVDAGMVELVVDDVKRLLSATPLEKAPICPVSSVTGCGLEELKRAILAVSRDTPPYAPLLGGGRGGTAPAQGPFRMAVDRVFTVQGRGTVVTGSVLRGRVSAGDTLVVWPAGKSCRVRGLQTHGVHHQTLIRGQRGAINISGIDRHHLQRGSELATPDYLQPSHLIDVRLECLSSYGRPLKSASIVRLEIGTTEVAVRAVLLEGGVLDPGASVYAQLRSGKALTAAYGQRFIIRDENATRTIGGGMVLRPVARRRRRELTAELDSLRRLETGDAADRVEEVLRLSGMSTPTDLRLCALAGVETDHLPEVMERLRRERRWVPIAGTKTHVVPAALDDLAQRLTGWLERHHRDNPQLPGRHIDAVLGWLERMTSRSLAGPVLDLFVGQQTLKLLGRFVCLPSFAPALSAADERLMAAMTDEIRAGGFQPPSLDGLSVAAQADHKRWERLATLAVAMGELVRIDGDLYLHADLEQQLRAKVADLITKEGGATVAQVREALASSRKFVVPFLEYLDREGFTKRVEDRRTLVEKSPRIAIRGLEGR